ncbi:hypothetical protein [Halanaerobium saccharolyticum]|uniref:hypothetical protein n=1 Tax=Halanaerobium saccharolyticum TaxID=43595 RepID=UPI0014152EB8|nr:hypothetical protein [Halanaerobium saccharolyticum]
MLSIFEKNKIEVVCGAAGEAKAAVIDYLNGKLDASANGCSHGDHDHQHQHNHEHHHGNHKH